jgi:hypothetical protein
MRWHLPLLACALAACSTPYQTMGIMGGVESQQITGTTYRIVARGNAAGGTHFAIISASDASSKGYVATAGHAQTSFVGNTAYTTFTPGDVYGYVRPGQDTYIRVFTVAPGQAPPPGVLSADEIVQFVGSRVKRG